MKTIKCKSCECPMYEEEKSCPDYGAINPIYSEKEDSKVEHPQHYNKGIECWDYVVSHNMGFLEGNVIKYVTRYKHKNGLEDLKKAKQYLDKLIEVVQNE